MAVVEHYKECPEYHSEFAEYIVGDFLACFDEVTRMMIQKGVDTTLPVLAELRSSFALLKPSCQEAVRLSSSVAQVPEAKTQLPTKEGVLTNEPI